MDPGQTSDAGPQLGAGGSARRRRAPLALALISVLLVAAGLGIAVVGGGSRSNRLGGSSPASATRGEIPAARHPLRPCGATCDPIDPAYLTDLRFGATSFWVQPWRAYLDTWPASRLLDAVGINFNVQGLAVPAVARLLHDTGFRLARTGTNWGGLSYERPDTFTREADLERRLSALRENKLRPLIILDANSGAPCPSRGAVLELTSSAPAGSRTVALTPASAAQVMPDRTGFGRATLNPGVGLLKRLRRALPQQNLTSTERRARRQRRHAELKARGLSTLVLSGNPSILITSVSASGVAALSRPLPRELAAGPHKAVTLLYAPFGSPTLPGGAVNPAFRATLAGWLTYVAAVTRVAKRIFGPGGFDLEVWNELGFGSQFLNAARYFSPVPSSGAQVGGKEVAKTLLRETISFVRDPRNGLTAAVGISNGFASQSPFSTGAFAPAGLTALSKHPYAGLKSMPVDFQAKLGRIPHDALGRRDTVGPHGSSGALVTRFVPRYESLFPEYFLTAGSAETLVRDIAPITTMIYRAPHGRYAAAPHRTPLQVWVTEYNLGFRMTTVPVGPDGVTEQTGAAATPADRAHFQAKALLRSLVALVNKGVAREYFFAATGKGGLAIVSPAFMSLAAGPGAAPEDRLGGETLTALGNLLGRFSGPGPGAGGARQLRLVSITQSGAHAQFRGDGTPAHPALYDREVLAVLPFQSSPTRFTIPIYVMTRDLLTLYQPSAPRGDIGRFDLPDERFRIVLANLPVTAAAPTITAYDPIRNSSTPARLVSRKGDSATIECAATDYPRILTVEYPAR